MCNQSYKGWTNRETWLVNVHFNPESQVDVDMAEESLWEEYNNCSLLMRDFIDINLVNWEELKDHFPELTECELCGDDLECENVTDSDGLDWSVCEDCKPDVKTED